MCMLFHLVHIKKFKLGQGLFLYNIQCKSLANTLCFDYTLAPAGLANGTGPCVMILFNHSGKADIILDKFSFP